MATRRGDHFLRRRQRRDQGRRHRAIRAPPAARVAVRPDEGASSARAAGPRGGGGARRAVPGVGELSFMQAGLFHWNGLPLWISRSGYTGEDGFEISVASRDAAALADALVGDERVKADRAWRARFAAARGGLPLYGTTSTATRPRSWPICCSPSASAAAARAASPARCGSWRNRQWPGPEAYRPVGRRQAAGARRRADPRSRGQ